MMINDQWWNNDKDVEAKSYNETKTIPTNFNGEKATCKNLSVFIFYLYFH